MRLRFGMVFFFQAEDGIRDADVTGVKTCALPISSTPRLCAHCLVRNVWNGCSSWPGSESSEEHTSELQSRTQIVCRLLLEKKKRCAADNTKGAHNICVELHKTSS